MKVVDQLRALGSHIQEQLPNVNRGGCCVYAAHTAKRLHQIGVPVWGIVAAHWTSANLNEVRLNNKPRNVREWASAGVNFNHVLIQFVHDGRIWTHDSENTTDRQLTKDLTIRAPILDGNLTVRELVSLAAETRWNPVFDREAGIPIIAAGVRKFLAKRALT